MDKIKKILKSKVVYISAIPLIVLLIIIFSFINKDTYSIEDEIAVNNDIQIRCDAAVSTGGTLTCRAYLREFERPVEGISANFQLSDGISFKSLVSSTVCGDEDTDCLVEANENGFVIAKIGGITGLGLSSDTGIAKIEFLVSPDTNDLEDAIIKLTNIEITTTSSDLIELADTGTRLEVQSSISTLDGIALQEHFEYVVFNNAYAPVKAAGSDRKTYDLNEEFSSDLFAYTSTVDAKYVQIWLKPTNSKSTVSATGAQFVKCSAMDGSCKIGIVVPSGTINGNSADPPIDVCEADGTARRSYQFKVDQDDYNIVNSCSVNDNYTFDGLTNKLKCGDNVVTIKVTSEDGSTNHTYTVTLHRDYVYDGSYLYDSDNNYLYVGSDTDSQIIGNMMMADNSLTYVIDSNSLIVKLDSTVVKTINLARVVIDYDMDSAHEKTVFVPVDTTLEEFLQHVVVDGLTIEVYNKNNTKITNQSTKLTDSGTFKIISGKMTLDTYNYTVKSTVTPPTNNLCQPRENATYTGSAITLVKATSGTGYTLSGYSQTNAKEDGYTITATLKDSYKWDDGSTGTKTFKCPLYKATPVITLSATSGSTVEGKSLTFNEKANVSGKFTNVSNDPSKALVNPGESASTVSANTNATVTVTPKASGSVTITVTFTPIDTLNYNSITTTSNGGKTYTVTIIPEETAEGITFDESLHVNEANKLIFKIKEGTKNSELLAKITTTGTAVITDKDDAARDADSVIRTGDKVKITLSDETVLGDLVGDGKIDMSDVTVLYRHVKKTYQITDKAMFAAADLVVDGELDMSDVTVLYRKIKGTITSLEDLK